MHAKSNVCEVHGIYVKSVFCYYGLTLAVNKNLFKNTDALKKKNYTSWLVQLFNYNFFLPYAFCNLLAALLLKSQGTFIIAPQ